MDNLPKYNTHVAGIEINIGLLLNKLVKDFFQYSRNTFDYIAQISNAACLASKKKKIEKVDFAKMKEVFDQQSYSQQFPTIQAWFDGIVNSNEYMYLDSFCNRSKHISDVYIKLSMSMFESKSDALINPFYKKTVQHGAQDVKSFLNTICSFVEQSFNSFISVLVPELPKKTFVANRYHQLNAYQQKLKGSPNSSFSMVFLTAPSSDINSMPEEIEVLFEMKDQDGYIEARNCSNINKIYIQDPSDKHKYLGWYESNEPSIDDNLLQYRRYTRNTADPNDLPLECKAMLEPENKNRFFHSNPYISFTSVSDDEEFQKRALSPF